MATHNNQRRNTVRHKPMIAPIEAIEREWTSATCCMFAESDHAGFRSDPIYVVVWPDHVLTPKYNGDASYIPYSTLAEARAAWPEAEQHIDLRYRPDC